MEVTERQLFVFRSVINGSLFELNRIGTSRQEAAASLTADLEKYIQELREITKAPSKPN